MEVENFILGQLNGTRRRLVRLLRSKDRTVRELADQLDLTRNAVRAQLSKLETDDIVEVTGRRPTRRKPEHVYGLTTEAEKLFPKSYDVLLNTVLSVLLDTGWINVDSILEETGCRLAQPYKPDDLEAAPTARVNRARDVLNELGGCPEVIEEQNAYWLKGTRCPVAASVRAHGEAACDLACALIEELTELPVERRCEADGERPQCRFLVDAK